MRLLSSGKLLSRLRPHPNPAGFLRSPTGEQPHPARRRYLLRQVPEVKRLCQPYPITALWILALVATQWGLALMAVPRLPWPALLLLIWLVGAPISHALFVLMHDCAHDLVSRHRWHNQVLAILCDLAQAIPSAASFRRFHLRHHAAMGQLGVDADLPTPLEARLVGHSTWRKSLWMCGFGLSVALRPFSSQAMAGPRGWLALNLVLVLTADLLLLTAGGAGALAYLLASTLVALGPHPLAGRWLAEHYVFFPGQQTASMYGWANRLAFNVGYHIEHHDLPSVPWVALPRIRELAPDLYHQPSHRSWGGCLWRFITDPSLSPYSRYLNERSY